MEYYPSGTLRSLFLQHRKAKKRISIRDLLKICSGVRSGLEFLHSMMVLHRDLKLDNILLDVQGQVKIVDLGTAYQFPSPSFMETRELTEIALSAEDSGTAPARSSQPSTDSFVGSQFYIAPEIRAKTSYSFPADIYAFGCCLRELLTLEWVQEHIDPESGHLAPLPPVPFLLAGALGGGGSSSGSIFGPSEGSPAESPPDFAARSAFRRLCNAMMSVRPRDRPSLAAIARYLAELPQSASVVIAPAFSQQVATVSMAVAAPLGCLLPPPDDVSALD